MQCAECDNIVRVGKVAGWRAGRANSRCYRCGSLRLEPYTPPAKIKVERKILTPQDAAALLNIDQTQN